MNTFDKACVAIGTLVLVSLLAATPLPGLFYYYCGPAGYFALAFGIDFAHSFYTGKKSLLLWPLRLVFAGLRAWWNRPQPLQQARRDPAFQRVAKVAR